MTVWFNGEFVGPTRVIAANDRGFLLADGAFETMLYTQGKLAFLDHHLNRLRAGLDVLGITPTASIAALPEIVEELARRHKFEGDLSCRVTITRGPGPRGLAPPAGVEPSMLVTVAALSPPLTTPRRLVVFDAIRKNASPLGRFKFLGGYGPNIAGLAFANKQGADDALLLNDEGAVICATSANIYLCSAGGEVKSPRVENGAMPGVVREVLLGERLGIELANVEVGELRDHCVFVSNSLIGIEQASVAGHECNMTEAQSVAFQRLRQSYARALAKNLSDVGRDS